MLWMEISPLSDCVLLFLFLQSLSASLNGKKAEAGPWIDILTSRDSDHLNKGEAVMGCICTFCKCICCFKYTHSLWPCVSLTVLFGLEMGSGQMVDQALEKKFTGDFRLGLKVLGKYCFRYCVKDYSALSMLIKLWYFFSCAWQYSAFKTRMSTSPKDWWPRRWEAVFFSHHDLICW